MYLQMSDFYISVVMIFYKFSQRSRYTIVNVDVYEHASKEDKLYILQNYLVLRSFYRREKGGFIKKIKFNILERIHKELSDLCTVV